MPIQPHQTAVRWLKDDAGIGFNTALASQNEDYNYVKGSGNLTCRGLFQVDEGIGLGYTGAVKAQLSTNAGSTWADVAASGPFRLGTTGQGYIDQAAILAGRLTIPNGDKSYTAGTIQTNDATSGSITIATGNYSEFEFCFLIVDASTVISDQYWVRVIESGGTVLDAYDHYLIVNVVPATSIDVENDALLTIGVS